MTNLTAIVYTLQLLWLGPDPSVPQPTFGLQLFTTREACEQRKASLVAAFESVAYPHDHYWLSECAAEPGVEQ